MGLASFVAVPSIMSYADVHTESALKAPSWLHPVQHASFACFSLVIHTVAWACSFGAGLMVTDGANFKGELLFQIICQFPGAALRHCLTLVLYPADEACLLPGFKVSDVGLLLEASTGDSSCRLSD